MARKGKVSNIIHKGSKRKKIVKGRVAYMDSGDFVYDSKGKKIYI